MDHYQYTTNESERKSGKHLTSEDRGAIQAMKKLGYSNRKIAAYLHCSPTTVSNEQNVAHRPKRRVVAGRLDIPPAGGRLLIRQSGRIAVSPIRFTGASGSFDGC